MKINVASDDFNQIFEANNIEGYVHSVFKNVINLKVNELMVTIVNSTVNIGPATAKLDGVVNFLDLGILRNMVFEKYDNQIFFQNNIFMIEYNPIEIWDTQPDYDFVKATAEEVITKIHKLENFMFIQGDSASISPIIMELKSKFDCLASVKEYSNVFENNQMKFIVTPIKNLLKAIEKDNWKEVDQLTQLSIGFGPGLTPSSDDFILGLMTGLLYTRDNHHEAIERNRHFVSAIDNKTTDISYEALMHASKGKVNQVIKKLVISILSDKSSDEMIVNAIGLIKIGKTSGTDILAGILVGMRLNITKGAF